MKYGVLGVQTLVLSLELRFRAKFRMQPFEHSFLVINRRAEFEKVTECGQAFAARSFANLRCSSCKLLEDCLAHHFHLLIYP